jgi:chemotaxis signal transduction protein
MEEIQPPAASFSGDRRRMLRGQVKQEDTLIILVDVGAVTDHLGGGEEVIRET